MPIWIDDLYFYVLTCGYKISDIRITENGWIVIKPASDKIDYPDMMTIQEWIDRCQNG